MSQGIAESSWVFARRAGRGVAGTMGLLGAVALYLTAWSTGERLGLVLALAWLGIPIGFLLGYVFLGPLTVWMRRRFRADGRSLLTLAVRAERSTSSLLAAAVAVLGIVTGHALVSFFMNRVGYTREMFDLWFQRNITGLTAAGVVAATTAVLFAGRLSTTRRWDASDVTVKAALRSIFVTTSAMMLVVVDLRRQGVGTEDLIVNVAYAAGVMAMATPFVFFLLYGFLTMSVLLERNEISRARAGMTGRDPQQEKHWSLHEPAVQARTRSKKDRPSAPS